MNGMTYPRRMESGSFGPYFEEEGGRQRIPEWATDKIGNYTAYGAAIGYATIGLVGLLKGTSLASLGPSILFGTIYFGFLGGLLRLGYNLLKHYMASRKAQQKPQTEDQNKS